MSKVTLLAVDLAKDVFQVGDLQSSSRLYSTSKSDVKN